MRLKDFKKRFDPALLNFLDSKTETLRKYNNRDLNNYLLHLRKILQGGKRIRPYLAFLCYKSYGGKEDNKAIKLLVFIEIFHAFCLVHDDILDKADYRHGVSTIHKFATDKTRASNLGSIHFGNSIAILIGDFLFSWAFELLFNNDNFGEKELKRVTNIFLKMIEEVFIGQFIDVKMSSDENPNEKSIFQKMYLKTAGYSFTHPMMIGASLVKEIKNEEFFKQFGLVLGISFQIQDDLFDIIYDSNEIFKSSFNDIAQHQHTIFTNYVFEKGAKKQREILRTYFIWVNN
ncbi:MAG: Geranylgeranyl pyrophosphate synthase [Parcubacteria group bacterium GW2011_GWB1_41_5]|nr:MAG: Geranylgeranyl pyrophosphate synthase [Parcubacteria group bacterium GW2011_GWB1_41_5]